MNRFKNILLYAGGDVPPTPAIERATVLAHVNGARLTLVDVLPKASAGPRMILSGWLDRGKGLAAKRRDELEEVANAVRQYGVDVETRILVGRPFVELIREVHRRGHDLVMKTAQGRGGSLGGIFGSTARHLLRKCPCPVWVIKPGGGSRGRVLAALDPDLEDPGNDTLSRVVLELASSIARSRDLELDIVHAWWSESMPHGHYRLMATETTDAIVEETRDIAAVALRKVLETVDLSGVAYHVHVTQGMPLEVISAFSKRAEVTVLGSLSRTGIAGAVIGNTAERILSQVDCSVLTVKPPGFASPVRLPEESLERCA